jgi:hypothetical protein
MKEPSLSKAGLFGTKHRAVPYYRKIITEERKNDTGKNIVDDYCFPVQPRRLRAFPSHICSYRHVYALRWWN